jgi:hypothetical protein
MAENEDASGSVKPFWKLSQELEEEEMEVDIEEREVEEEEMEGVDQEDMVVEEEDMEGTDNTITTTSSGKYGTQRKKKPRKDMKDRRPNQLLPDRQEFAQVWDNGYPLPH